jgi:ATP-dependent helicase YprA (DUF1998 family)
MCDGHDIGISITSDEIDAGPGSVSGPQKIFVYDNYPGGIGFSAPLYDMHHELLAATRRLIAECPCENGCPGCVGPIGNTGPLAKVAALRILDLLLEDQMLTPGSKGPGLQAGDAARPDRSEPGLQAESEIPVGRVLSDPPTGGEEEVVPF